MDQQQYRATNQASDTTGMTGGLGVSDWEHDDRMGQLEERNFQIVHMLHMRSQRGCLCGGMNRKRMFNFQRHHPTIPVPLDHAPGQRAGCGPRAADAASQQV